MNLENIKNKLNTILNDNTVNTLATKYKFVCVAEGYYLDSVIDTTVKKNIIPVFVGAMGGNVNPVPGLNEVDYNVDINFYFPVNFKEDFYSLDDILKNYFSGKIVDFGSQISPITVDNALCNISIPKYNVIMDAGLGELKSWTSQVFGLEIDTARYWMGMNLTLFLNTANNLGQYGGFIMGNSVEITSLVFKYNGVTILTETSPIIIERADIVSSTPAVQQLFSETYSKGFPANTGYTRQLPLIIKNNSEYRSLLNYIENVKDMQKITVVVTESIPFKSQSGTTISDNPLSISTTYFITDYSRKTAIGEFLGLNFTLSVLRT